MIEVSTHTKCDFDELRTGSILIVGEVGKRAIYVCGEAYESGGEQGRSITLFHTDPGADTGDFRSGVMTAQEYYSCSYFPVTIEKVIVK